MKSITNIAIYFISKIIEKGVVFLFIPLYTYYLNPKEYGLFNIFQSIIIIGITIGTLSLNAATNRYFYDGNNFYKKFLLGNIFSSMTFIYIIFSSILSLSFIFIKNFVSIKNFYIYIYLILFLIYFNAIYMFFQTKLQMEQNAILYAKNNIIRFLITSFFILYFLIILKMKITGILLGQLLGFLIFYFFIIYKLKKENIKFNLNKKLLKKNLSYSIKLIPHNIASFLNQFIDKIFISKFINLTQTGIYSLGNQISMGVFIFSNSINIALVPITIKAFKEKNYKLIIKIADISVMFVSIISLIISLFSKEIINLISLSNVYNKAYIVIPILTFYFAFQMYYYRTVSILYYIEKATKYISFSTILSLIFNIFLNILLIKKYGIIGASIATLLSMIIINYIVIYFGNKFIKINFNHIKLHFFILFAFFISLISNIYNINFYYKLILLLLTTLLYIYIEKENFLILKKLILKRINK